jgi:hypothetical protein
MVSANVRKKMEVILDVEIFGVPVIVKWEQVGVLDYIMTSQNCIVPDWRQKRQIGQKANF